MTDFFRMLGKAFAIVFGSMSALALTLILFALAVRPVVRSWVRETPINTRIEERSVAPHGAAPAGYGVLRLCMEWDREGNCIDPVANEWNLSLGNCSKDGCFVYGGNVGVGYLSRNEVTKAYRAGGGKEFSYDSQGNRIK